MQFQIEAEFIDFERTIEDVTAQIMRTIAEDAPGEMQNLMPEGGISIKGSPPHKRSGDLSRSLKAVVTAPKEIELSMEGYGAYLDPNFEGSDIKGAGWADRPFIDLGIQRALQKNL